MLPCDGARCAASSGFQIDPALVDSLADAPAGLMTRHPYLSHFRKGELNLFFVAGHHERGKNSETCVLIRRAFEKFTIKKVVVEGRSYEWGDIKRDSIDDIRRHGDQWSETYCAIMTAWRRGIKSIGGETGYKDQLRAVREAGFSTEDYLADSFIKMIPSYRMEGKLGKERIEDLFMETMGWHRSQADVPDDVRFAYKDFLAWHRNAMGEDFEPAKVDYERLKPSRKGTVLQRIAESIDIDRNRFLATVLSRQLGMYKDVLVVYGNGHHAALRRAVVAAMSEPIYQGP
jgi:hypothetical protein